jgi:hypothetical protein
LLVDTPGVLIYMSVREEIQYLCDIGRLARFWPLLAVPKHRRAMYVSKSIEELLINSWDSPQQEFRWGYVLSDLTVFVRDPWITVAADPRRAKAAYMARLLPDGDEVWDVRCRDPHPGIRLLGRFAEKNVFIALTWEERLPLGRFESDEWKAAISRCATEWNLHFWSDPLRGNYPDDYLDGADLR